MSYLITQIAGFHNFRYANFFALLVGFALVPLWWVIINNIEEFNVYYIFFANAMVVFSVAIESVALVSLARLLANFKNKNYLPLFAMVVIVLAGLNVWTFGATVLDLKNRYSIVISIILATFFLWLFYRPNGKRKAITFSALLILIALINKSIPHILRSLDTVDSAQEFHNVTKSLVVPKRNVYVLVFDSLVSKEAYQEIYGENELPWTELLTDEKFLIVNDAIAAGDDTRSSFGTIFNFGSFSYKLSMTGFENPVYQWFLDNGYKTAFLTDSTYFGVSKRYQLDYLYPVGMFHSVCRFSPRYFLFGACAFGIAPGEAGNSYKHLLNNFDEFVTNKQDNGQKWLTVVYTWYPGHSPVDREYTYVNPESSLDWHNTFLSNAEKSVKVIGRFINKIKLDDPGAAILIFGDHGSWYFRTDDGSHPDSISNGKIDLDKYGVFFAAYPRDLCASYFKGQYEIKKLFQDLLRCGAV